MTTLIEEVKFVTGQNLHVTKTGKKYFVGITGFADSVLVGSFTTKREAKRISSLIIKTWNLRIHSRVQYLYTIKH